MRWLLPLLALIGFSGFAQERPPITGISHISLKTNDLPAATAFYGHVLGFALLPDKTPARFQVNGEQFIEISPDLRSATEDRLSHIAFLTADVERLRDYLLKRGVKAPAVVDRRLTLTDPDGHAVAFVEAGEPAAIPNGDERISQRIIHVGVTVADRAAADRFYKNILGFRESWHGGMRDDVTDWVDMRVPDGTDWLEYMLNVHHPSPRTLGVMHHLALGVPSVEAAYQTVVKRGLKPEKPQIGRDGKWQLNLYDPNWTRVELMEPKPVQKPCCAHMLDQ